MSAPAFCSAAAAAGLPARALSARPARCGARGQRLPLPRSAFAPGCALRGGAPALHTDRALRGRAAPQMAAGGTKKKAVVAGGTGFIGARLAGALVAAGYDVVVLTRGGARVPAGCRAVRWDAGAGAGDDTAVADALRGAAVVANLAGHPVVSRWTPAGRQLITGSRVGATSALARAVAALPAAERPACVLSASAVGFYGEDSAAAVDEAAPAADGFLPDVCRQWEAAAQPMADLTRLVVFRIGVVVGPGGGALARMLPAFQLGLGGPVGDGKQCVSWVHVDDIVGMFLRAAENEEVEGVYNATAPQPVDMQEFSGALARALGRPNLFPVPGFVLKIAFGEAADVVLKGQRVLPKRWLAEGFKYAHPDINSAMQAVADEVRK